MHLQGVLKSSSMCTDVRSEGHEAMGRDLIFLPKSALPKGGIVQWLRARALELNIMHSKSTCYWLGDLG